MITRTFRTIAELNTMLVGYQMLFSATPTVLALSADELWDGNDPIFPRRPLPILKVGTKTITIEVDGQPCRIRPDAQHCQLSVVFE